MEKESLLEDGRSSFDSDIDFKLSPFVGQDNSHITGKATKSKPKTKTSITKLFLAVLLGAIITQLIHYVVHWYIQRTTVDLSLSQDMGTLHLPSSQTTTCGDSPATAAAAGCIFDPTSFSWFPPQCYDAQTASDFLSWNWTWYDSEGDPTTLPAAGEAHLPPHAVAHDAAVAGDLPELLVTDEYHLVHCIYTWRKMHRALNAESTGWAPESVGAFMDSYTRKWSHTEHCTDALLKFVKNMHAHQRESRSKSAKGHSERRNQEDVGVNLDMVRTSIAQKYPSCPIAIDKLNDTNPVAS